MSLVQKVKLNRQHFYLIASFIVVLAIIYLLVPRLFGNKAEALSHSITRRLGGKRICDRGDNGRGIDNSLEYYDAYYSFDSSVDLKPKVMRSAQGAGYTLSTDNGEANQTASRHDHSDFLVSKEGSVRVQIARAGDEIDIQCSNDEDIRTVGNNEQILEINVIK